MNFALNPNYQFYTAFKNTIHVRKKSMNKAILLNKRPSGSATLSNFKISREEIPVIRNGQILLKTLYVSVDPYLRGRMTENNLNSPLFELNKPIQSMLISSVMESKLSGFNIGEIVVGMLDWKEYQVSDGIGLRKIDSENNNLTTYLGVLGISGLTAYLGLTEIGMPKADETLVVSSAGGAVGSIVGQIGKIMGCKVIGITGSDQKADFLKTKLKFDEAINYKSQSDLYKSIKNASPDGVDIYFDNVGGEISDAVLNRLNKFARVVVCGTLSEYNETFSPLGPRIQPIILAKSAKVQGFNIDDYTHKFSSARLQLGNWLSEGRLTYAETIIKGFDNIPNAFLDLFEGKNEGKMIVKV